MGTFVWIPLWVLFVWVTLCGYLCVGTFVGFVKLVCDPRGGGPPPNNQGGGGAPPPLITRCQILVVRGFSLIESIWFRTHFLRKFPEIRESENPEAGKNPQRYPHKGTHFVWVPLWVLFVWVTLSGYICVDTFVGFVCVGDFKWVHLCGYLCGFCLCG